METRMQQDSFILQQGASSSQECNGFKLLKPGDSYPSLLDHYLAAFVSEKCGLAQVVAFKISYCKLRDIWRARIDTRMRVVNLRQQQRYGSSDCPSPNGLLLFQTDYIELRGVAGTVQHIGTRHDPESDVGSGSGLTGKVSHWHDYCSWCEWIDEQ